MYNIHRDTIPSSTRILFSKSFIDYTIISKFCQPQKCANKILKQTIDFRYTI